MRTFVSFLRLDDTVLGTGLRTAQLIGIASMVLALGAIIYLLRFPPKEERASRVRRRRQLREEAPAAPGEEPAG